MHRTFCLVALAAFCKANSTPDVFNVACSRHPELPQCRIAKRDAQRDVLFNRLKILKGRTKDDHLERRAGDVPIISQRVERNHEFTKAHDRTRERKRKSGSSSEDSLVIPPPVPAEALVIPPPLPKLDERQELQSLTHADFLEKTKDSRSSHKRGKAMDQTKWQALKSRSRPSKNSGKDVTFPTDPKELYRTLKALNSLTAEPMTFLKDDTMSGNSLFSRPRAYQSRTVDPSEQKSEADEDVFKKFSELTDIHGIYHRARSRSPFTKPGLWEANPDNPHNRDHANKWWYNPRSVTVDWLNGQVAWGGHWAVPAAGVGGTEGYSTVHFPSLGTFLGIPDDYE